MIQRRYKSTKALQIWKSKDVCSLKKYVYTVQGVSQLLKQSDWAQIQDFK